MLPSITHFQLRWAMSISNKFFFQCAFNFLAIIKEYTCILIYPWPYCSECSIRSSFFRETRQTGMPKKREFTHMIMEAW